MLETRKAALTFRRLSHVSFPENIANLSTKEFRQIRKDITRGAEHIIGIGEKEGRALTPDESDALDWANERLDEINNAIDFRTQQGIPETASGADLDQYTRKRPITVLEQADESRIKPQKWTDYRSFFGIRSMPTSEFSSFDQFLAAAAARQYDPRLERRSFLEADGTLGGYAVPEAYAADIFNQAIEQSVVVPRARVIPATSNILHVPAWDHGDRSTSGLYSGFEATFISEGGTATEKTAKLRSMTFSMRKMVLYCSASREALADGIGLGDQIGMAMREALGFYMDFYSIQGSLSTGGQPMGILASPSRIVYGRASANQIALSDVFAMYSRMWPSCLTSPSCVWLAHPTTLPQLLSLSDTGSHNVWIPASYTGIAGDIPAKLLGKPLLFTEKVKALGSEGDLVLVDLSQFGVAMRQQLILETSPHVHWTEDLLAFRAILRWDAMPMWDEALTPLGSSDTLSWAVVLGS